MNTPFGLYGKTILVTGASSGIGRCTCIEIAKMGGKIIALGRNKERLEETCCLLEGEGHIPIMADLCLKEERQKILEKVGKIQGMVHSAGVCKLVPFKFYNEQNFREHTLLNYEVPVFFTQELYKAKKIEDGSSLVFIASIGSLIGKKANGIYSGSKGALVSITRVLAMELAPKKIRVNCISPGMVESPILEATGASEEQNREHIKMYPLGPGKQEDVAHCCIYLLSQASRWVTGINLIVDGGLMVDRG